MDWGSPSGLGSGRPAQRVAEADELAGGDEGAQVVELAGLERRGCGLRLREVAPGDAARWAGRGHELVVLEEGDAAAGGRPTPRCLEPEQERLEGAELAVA